MTAPTAGTRLRAKHGWTGTVVDVTGRHRWRIRYAQCCLGDGTDVFVHWDDRCIVGGKNTAWAYGLATIRRMEIVDSTSL